MTTAAAITALEALTADTLKSANDGQLARLEELGNALAWLIDAEKDRRNPTQGTDDTGAALEHLTQSSSSKERAERRLAEHYAQQSAIREAVEYCATNPALHARLKVAFHNE